MQNIMTLLIVLLKDGIYELVKIYFRYLGKFETYTHLEDIDTHIDM